MKKLNLQLFANVFDLSDLLEEKPSTIVIGDKTFIINDRFSDILAIDALMKGEEGKPAVSDIAFVSDFMKIAFGENAAAVLMGYNFPLKAYKRIIEAVKSTIAGATTEDKSTPS